jgi:hypothetical protein
MAIDESLDGSILYTGDLTKSLSVSGSTLTITLDANQLYENNLVITTLKSTIESTSDVALGADDEYFFATRLNPFYAATRLVRLRMGAWGNSFADETINLAIWDASREADAIAPSSISDSDGYRRARQMYVACLATWYLIGGGKIASEGQRKRLADLDVSSDSGASKDLLEDLKDCFQRYELAMRTGGDAGYGSRLRPRVAVKGEDDLDEPAFGRQWHTGGLPVGNSRYSLSIWRRWYHTFRRR